MAQIQFLKKFDLYRIWILLKCLKFSTHTQKVNYKLNKKSTGLISDDIPVLLYLEAFCVLKTFSNSNWAH